MRLIDAEALKSVLKWHHSVFIGAEDEVEKAHSDALICAIREVVNAPTIDAVPVVRCRDCKYSDTFPDGADNDMPLKCLSIRYGGVYPDWYCEHGERKDGDA